MTVLLYNRSCYSLLESILTIEKMVSFACENGYKAIGLCDRNVMYGAMKFHKLCNDRGIKPLIGLQIEFSFNEKNYPLIIYPKNDSQFQFLIALSTRLNSGESSVTLEQISAFPDDIILIVPADNELIIRSRKENDQNALHQIISAFSGKDVYLATGSSSNAYYNSLNVNIRQAAADFGYKSVAAPLSCYCDKTDSYGYRALLAAGKQLLINDERLISDDTLYLRTPEEMTGVYPADELRRSDEIADKIDVRMDFAVNSLPVYQTGTSADSKTYLKALCNLGLRKRLDSESVPKEYQNRLNYELDVICSMNYQDYFLIVYDIYLFAKKREIYMGVGRGSVCGCLVAYCLGITHVDPLRYGLLFERFLNPERISMPDIDIDIPDDRRSEVIEYIRKKYGEDHTAHIITFNTYGARNALREACRQYSIVSSKKEVLLSSIESGNSVTVKESVRNNPKFQQAIEAIDDRNHNVLRTALALEGLPHNISTHAAGLLISRRKLSETIPLVKLSDSTILSQYTNSYLEAMGLIKFDLLGLKNLSLIDNIVSQIRKTTDFNVLSIPLDDKRTFEILSSGKTAGIFQMESFGMNRLIRQVNPQRIEDIIDCIALYRPGPMENIPLYLQARSNPGRINCLHRDLEWILKPTYGIMIYQEQIMQISQVIAGFSYGKADILRRAISKKD
ncbi:MAG: DNA polymerase III subunit alpha, partial [Erysipelotrichaceae bacterium]|nr:DNA polymerase III subunit alpha [Erysipelotrichaceae bacterium]